MNENPKEPDSSDNRAAVTFIWLIVGLAPIVIILGAASSNGTIQDARAISVITIICNLLGGFGCVRNVEDILARIIVGLFLSGGFFVLCVIVAVFQACSHMQF